MDQANIERLEVFRRSLVQASAEVRNADSMSKASTLDGLKSSLLQGFRFAGTSEDYSLFANMWILLKDWANGNMHEVQNRYFSSHQEIQRWIENAAAAAKGFRLTSSLSQKYSYTLLPERFNERGLNRVHRYLETRGSLPPDMEKIKELWMPSERFELFVAFSNFHLWPRARSPLGAVADAFHGSFNLGDLEPVLAEIPGVGTGFRLPVYVIELEKVEDGAEAVATTKATTVRRVANPGDVTLRMAV